VHNDVAKFIDHTLLSPTATRAEITKLCEEAKENKFAAVCVNPCHVRQAVKELSSTDVAVATVIGFPLGANLTDVKVAEAQKAIAEGAEELDMVINIGFLKDGLLDLVESDIAGVVKVAKAQNILVKVILETDLLTDDEKVAATKLCIKAGAGIVKTSTGTVKDGKGATLEDVALIKKTLAGTSLGIKASGGIRDYEKAKQMIDAGATRLGTSAGVTIVKGAQPVSAGY
jgi:deoxyribose-phosphate aldolase